jgi:hypothetical protein
MVWQRTSHEAFDCPPAVLWGVIGDPRRWPEWCDAVGPDCRLTQRIVVEGLLAPAVVLGVAAGPAGSW